MLISLIVGIAEGGPTSIMVSRDSSRQLHEYDDSLPIRLRGVGRVHIVFSYWSVCGRICEGLIVLPGMTGRPIERLQKVILGV